MNDRTEQLGLVAELLFRTAGRQMFRVHWIRQWIEPAVMHRQISFAFDETGRALAYWTWAFLAEDVESRLYRKSPLLLHESEWNEGSRLWIMDFVAPFGFVADLVGHLRASLLKDFEGAQVLRWAPDETVRRVGTWHAVKGERARLQNTSERHHRLRAEAFASSQSEWRANRSADRAQGDPLGGRPR